MTLHLSRLFYVISQYDILPQMDQLTVNAYNNCAQNYDEETKNFWEAFPRTIVDSFVQGLKGGLVLSIGSGPGRDAEIMRDAGLEITCFDASTTMVEMTRAKGFESICGDLLNLPFSGG